SLVNELQHLFGNLTLSERQAVDTLPLLRAIKDFDGNPIDVSVQQDAQGFLLDLFDKLEKGLKSTCKPDLLKSAFEGHQITQLICPTPPPKPDTGTDGHPSTSTADEGTQFPNPDKASLSLGVKGPDMRERGEAFMCLSLEVKNMRGVEDALNKFTEKETISGYMWDEQRRDVEIHKRTVLGSLPDTLMVHLNRFQINLDTFQTEKVNTRFEFDTWLDLEPFTKEGLAWREAIEAGGLRGPEELKALGIPGPFELHPREHYLYQLRGVVVHFGTANHGHYFSYIRDKEFEGLAKARCDNEGLAAWAGEGSGTGTGTGSCDRESASGGRSNSGTSPGTVPVSDLTKQAWYEFNDAIVKEWKVAGSAEDAMGGGVGEDGKGMGTVVGGGRHGLETSCFGGQQMMQETDEYGWSRSLRKDNNQNAYLLFYDRVKPELSQNTDRTNKTVEDATGQRVATQGSSGPGGNQGEVDVSGGLGVGARDTMPLPPTMSTAARLVPPEIFRDVWDENNRFLFELQLCHPDLAKLVLDMLSSAGEIICRGTPRSHTPSGGRSPGGSRDEDGCGIRASSGGCGAAAPTQPADEVAKAAKGGERGESAGDGGQGSREGVSSRRNLSREELAKALARWGTAYALENLAHVLHNELFPKVLDELKGLYGVCPSAAAAFLDIEISGGMKGMKELLLACPDRHVRQAVVGFYLHLLGILAQEEGDWYLEYNVVEPEHAEASPICGPRREQPPHPFAGTGVMSAPFTSTPSPGSAEDPQQWGGEVGEGGDLMSMAGGGGQTFHPRTRLAQVVDGWVGLLPDAARAWSKMEQFLEFIEGVGNMGDRERDLLLRRHMISKLIDFFLQEKSPVHDPKRRLPHMGHKTAPPKFSPLVRCLRALWVHSGEAAQDGIFGTDAVAGSTDTASNSTSRSDESISSDKAVVSMPVGPISHTSGTLRRRRGTCEVDEILAAEATAALTMRTALELSVVEAQDRGDGLGGNEEEDGHEDKGDNNNDEGGGGVGEDKRRGESRDGPEPKVPLPELTLTLGDRRCLSCPQFFEQAFEDNHAPDEAAEVMCGWARGSMKLLLPFSRLLREGVENSRYPDLRPWLMALKAWLALDDGLEADRLSAVLGEVKVSPAAPDPGLLMLMWTQKDKNDRWLFRVLQVVSEMLVENEAVGTYVGQQITPVESAPWSDWFLKHLHHKSASITKWAPPEELIDVSDRIRRFEKEQYGETSEERRRAVEMKAIPGPVKGEAGMNRIESEVNNGVQVETLDWSEPRQYAPGSSFGDHGPFSVDDWIEDSDAVHIPSESPKKRLWRVTNHRFDMVHFSFWMATVPDKRGNYPNYHPIPHKSVDSIIGARSTHIIYQVTRRDPSQPFGTWSFNWKFEAVPAHQVGLVKRRQAAEEAAAEAADAAFNDSGDSVAETPRCGGEEDVSGVEIVVKGPRNIDISGVGDSSGEVFTAGADMEVLTPIIQLVDGVATEWEVEESPEVDMGAEAIVVGEGA
ncbi:unnamed protein product, partial [Discosporangium mesarthrocarpum]